MAIGCLETYNHFDVTTLDDVKADTCDARVIHARFARDEIIKSPGSHFAPRFARNNNNNNNNNNNKFNPNLLLITKLTIKSYLQLISLKKLFRQSTIYIIYFD